MLFLRSSLFLVGQWLSAGFFAIACFLFIPFTFKTRYRFISQWSRFNLWWLGKTCNLYYAVKGQSNIPEQSSIIFCKHQSAWETLALQQIFPPQTWLIKRELLFIPFFGWGLAMLDPIAIDRKLGTKSIFQLVKQGKDRLAKGRWLVIFPEGTRVEYGKKKKYQKGGALLAERTGYPVIPVAHNAGKYWPRNSFIKYPGTIRVEIGPAIQTQGIKAEKINETVEQWIEGSIMSMDNKEIENL